jgi:hypothetical protein
MEAGEESRWCGGEAEGWGAPARARRRSGPWPPR